MHNLNSDSLQCEYEIKQWNTEFLKVKRHTVEVQSYCCIAFSQCVFGCDFVVASILCHDIIDFQHKEVRLIIPRLITNVEASFKVLSNISMSMIQSCSMYEIFEFQMYNNQFWTVPFIYKILSCACHVFVYVTNCIHI